MYNSSVSYLHSVQYCITMWGDDSCIYVEVSLASEWIDPLVNKGCIIIKDIFGLMT